MRNAREQSRAAWNPESRAKISRIASNAFKYVAGFERGVLPIGRLVHDHYFVDVLVALDPVTHLLELAPVAHALPAL